MTRVELCRARAEDVLARRRRTVLLAHLRAAAPAARRSHQQWDSSRHGTTRRRRSGTTGRHDAPTRGRIGISVLRQRARAQGTDLRTDGRDRRRADHVVARRRRRRAELGLPLLLAARRALNLYALSTLGYTEEAHAFMAGSNARPRAGREDLQIMYGIGGERLPARSANSTRSTAIAGRRRCASATRRPSSSSSTSTAICSTPRGCTTAPAATSRSPSGTSSRGAVDVVAEHAGRFPTKASGRSAADRAHFVSSKIMAWVAVDRAIRLAQRAQPSRRHRSMERAATRDPHRRSRRTVSTREPARSCSAFGELLQLDASNLLAALVRFLPRRRSTGREQRSRARPPSSRPRPRVPVSAGRDGLPGPEATFAICSFWLVDNLALAGESHSAPGSSNACSATATTSVCWPRRSIPAPASCSATFPKPSVTSASSAPRSTCSAPSARGDTACGPLHKISAWELWSIAGSDGAACRSVCCRSDLGQLRTAAGG